MINNTHEQKSLAQFLEDDDCIYFFLVTYIGWWLVVSPKSQRSTYSASKMSNNDKLPIPDDLIERHYNPGVDRITMKPELRWKTSEYSGDEWRYGGRVKFYHKGALVKSIFHNLSWSSRLPDDALTDDLNTFLKEPISPEELERREPLCDQFGCANVGVLFRMLAHQSTGFDLSPPDGKVHVKRFCEHHANRGTCAIIDRSDNYELLSTQTIHKSQTLELPSPEVGRMTSKSEQGRDASPTRK